MSSDECIVIGPPKKAFGEFRHYFFYMLRNRDGSHIAKAFIWVFGISASLSLLRYFQTDHARFNPFIPSFVGALVFSVAQGFRLLFIRRKTWSEIVSIDPSGIFLSRKGERIPYGAIEAIAESDLLLTIWFNKQRAFGRNQIDVLCSSAPARETLEEKISVFRHQSISIRNI
jgi:hypothetical protein